jgi:hypothetical protein
VVLLAASKVAVARPIGTDGCNVERAGSVAFGEGPVTVWYATSIEIEGWVVDPRRHDVPLDASLHLQSGADRVVLPLRHRKVRPDVVAVFKDDRVLIAGFILEIPAMTLKPGEWRVWIEYRSAGKAYSCDNRRRLVVQSAER